MLYASWFSLLFSVACINIANVTHKPLVRIKSKNKKWGLRWVYSFIQKNYFLFFRTSFLNPASTCLLHREYVYDSYDSHTIGITNAININMIINSKLLQAQSWTRVLTVLLINQSCSSPASGTSWERNNIKIPNESKYMNVPCSLWP